MVALIENLEIQQRALSEVPKLDISSGAAPHGEQDSASAFPFSLPGRLYYDVQFPRSTSEHINPPPSVLPTGVSNTTVRSVSHHVHISRHENNSLPPGSPVQL